MFSRPLAVPDKPTTSPWVSTKYVLSQHSADGNSYRPGDPIPEEEARRQGLISDHIRYMDRCQRCRGFRHYMNPVPKGHRIGCACKFCGPCPRCGGTGREAA